MKISTSIAAWIRVYTDTNSRTNDELRTITIPPSTGSGVICEVATTTSQTIQIITPFIFGGNLENTPNNTIYIRATNLSNSTSPIGIFITVLPLEY